MKNNKKKDLYAPPYFVYVSVAIGFFIFLWWIGLPVWKWQNAGEWKDTGLWWLKIILFWMFVGLIEFFIKTFLNKKIRDNKGNSASR